MRTRPFTFQLADIIKKVDKNYHAIYEGSFFEVQDSVIDGSSLTGSPGQPVKTGRLKDSWYGRKDDEYKATVFTNLFYAKSIEDGVSYTTDGGPIKLQSAQGGFHSVALTEAHFDKVVEDVTRKVKSSND